MSRSPCDKLARSTYLGLRRHALTLLELVVVLGILAALSSVAVRSLGPIADQARYEQTQRLLNNLQTAIVGIDTNAKQPNPASSSFITDAGVLPADLTDLLVKPAGLIDRTVQSFDSDRDSINDVNLTSGWNGPYLHFGAGQSDLVDGWGGQLNLIASAGDLTIESFGSDGDSLAPEDAYRADITVSIPATDYLGTVVFRLYGIDGMTGSRIDPAPTGSDKLGVLFYGVNSTGGNTGAIAEQLLLVSGSSSFENRRDDTLVGSTAARAIQWTDIDNDDQLDVGETIVLKSTVLYPCVHPRNETRVELELR